MTRERERESLKKREVERGQCDQEKTKTNKRTKIGGGKKVAKFDISTQKILFIVLSFTSV